MAKITRIKQTAEKTESGLIVPTTIIETKEPYYVVESAQGEWKVVSQSGELARIYSEDKPEINKANAESYAAKLSAQYR